MLNLTKQSGDPLYAKDINDIVNAINSKPDTIEVPEGLTPEDFKTINGQSLIGDGNIVIVADGDDVDLSEYLTAVDAANTYQPVGDYLTNISWNDVSNKPNFFDGNYNSLSNVPQLFDGSYLSLTNLPQLFDGNYLNLSNKPPIPSIEGLATETFVTGRGYITSTALAGYLTADNASTIYQPKGNYLTSVDWSIVTNTPVLFSGSYLDLTNRPSIPSIAGLATETFVNSALTNKVDKDGTKVLSDVNFSTAKDAKLNGIAINATANDTDVNLRNRSNHTGTQAISTITNLQSILDGKATPANITAAIVNKVDKDGTKVLSDTNFTQAEKTKLSGVATNATANDTDVNLRSRSNHTGTQAISTITNLQNTLNSLSAASAVVSYYVDPILGNDNNSGLSINQAWQTLAKVTSTTYTVPTKIQLKAGSSFTGQIIIGSGSTGSILLTTYGGKDKAIINKPLDLNGIEVIDKGNFIIENVIFDCTSTNIYDVTSGIGIYSELQVVSNFIIRNCEVRNCNTFAVAIGVGGASGNKMYNLHIHDCLIYGNANGIFTYGVNDNEYSIENVLIERVKAYDNLGLFTTTWTHTGSGIIAGGLKNGIIQNCIAYNNGQNNNGESGGPFGIWTYNSDGVVIQFCSSYDNKTSAGREDGGGFDIDGGCKNCIIQYCDSYNNYGPGFMLCEFGSPNLSEKNIIRENTSRNDGRAGQKGALAIHGYVTNAVFRDNKIYFDLAGKIGAATPVVFATYNPIMVGIVIRDNEFYLGDSVAINSLGLTSDKILFRNNRVKNLTNTEFITV